MLVSVTNHFSESYKANNLVEIQLNLSLIVPAICVSECWLLATTGVPLETPEAPAAERSWLSVGAFSLVSFFWAGTLGLRSTRRKRSSLKVFVCRVGVPGQSTQFSHAIRIPLLTQFDALIHAELGVQSIDRVSFSFFFVKGLRLFGCFFARRVSLFFLFLLFRVRCQRKHW